jgi:hypothetical protein
MSECRHTGRMDAEINYCHTCGCLYCPDCGDRSWMACNDCCDAAALLDDEQEERGLANWRSSRVRPS